jgi:hypothetical protein
MPGAYVTQPLDEEGFCIVSTLQAVNGLEIGVERVSISLNHGLVVLLQVEVIGDNATGTCHLRHLAA